MHRLPHSDYALSAKPSCQSHTSRWPLLNTLRTTECLGFIDMTRQISQVAGTDRQFVRLVGQGTVLVSRSSDEMSRTCCSFGFCLAEVLGVDGSELSKPPSVPRSVCVERLRDFRRAGSPAWCPAGITNIRVSSDLCHFPKRGSPGSGTAGSSRQSGRFGRRLKLPCAASSDFNETCS